MGIQNLLSGIFTGQHRFGNFSGEMKRILLIVIVLSAGGIVASQSGNDTIQEKYNEALYYMRGVNKPHYPARALNIFLDLADSGVAKAMNAAAIMYEQGIGTDQDYSAAYYWYEKAAYAGYYKAYYNLGLLWKYGYGVERNESKAFECYVTGADQGDPDCQYALGYMFYKGLACEQDYLQALRLFLDAASSGNAAASYMIGICYRNGYGIARDETEAQRWLEISSSSGNHRADIELASEEAENNFSDGSSTSGILYDVPIPETYTKIEYNLNDINIAGKYQGYLVTYDWSGEYIIGLSPLKLDLHNDGLNIYGQCIESDTNIVMVNASITDTGLVFVNMKYGRTDHYHSEPVEYDFNSASIQIIVDDSIAFLTGNIQFFSELTIEPERPIYISLLRTEVPKGNDIPDLSGMPVYDLRAFPNPFRDQLYISFELLEEAEVGVMVFTADGKKLYQADLGKLPSGPNIQQLQLNVPGGIYIVKVICGSASLTTKIVR